MIAPPNNLINLDPNESTIETEHWKITIPDDWLDKSNDDARLYFESEDGTKGFYISTLRFNDPQTKPHQVLDSFNADFHEEKSINILG